MKMLFGCGVLFGFRGSAEHTFLATRNVYHGDFPSHHPFKGYSWYGIDGLTDKSHKLSVNTDYVRNTKDCMRVPIMNDDPTSDDMGGCIGRYLEKLAPGQTRLYCQTVKSPVTDESTGKIQYFYANLPLGKGKIMERFKEGAGILGIPNPEKFAPHALRSYFITNMANGPGVSDQERMDSSRHSSLGASAIYQERDCDSETNKFAAIGIKIPSPKMTSNPVKLQPVQEEEESSVKSQD